MKTSLIYIQFGSVQSLSLVWLFATPWITARQASLSITNSWSSPKLTSIKSVMPSSHLILWVVPFSSCPQSLPASGSFPVSQLFAWGGQSIGVSALASVLPMNTQDRSSLGWTGWIFLQSKGLSRVFSNTTVQKHKLFRAQLSSQSNSHIHTLLLSKAWAHVHISSRDMSWDRYIDLIWLKKLNQYHFGHLIGTLSSIIFAKFLWWYLIFTHLRSTLSQSSVARGKGSDWFFSISKCVGGIFPEKREIRTTKEVSNIEECKAN